MKVLAISDLHGHLPAIEPCDLLLLGGDLCPYYNHTVDAQAIFINTTFADWLEKTPARHIVGIAGNHDFVYDRAPHLITKPLRWTYLQDSETTVEGVRIYGSPWSPLFGHWAFMKTEADLITAWSNIPEGLDVLMVHSPPHGYGDLMESGVNVGSPYLLERLGQVRPKLTFVGHIHEAHGHFRVPAATGGAIDLYNVAHVDAGGKPRHPAMVFEL